MISMTILALLPMISFAQFNIIRPQSVNNPSAECRKAVESAGSSCNEAFKNSQMFSPLTGSPEEAKKILCPNLKW